MLTETMMKKAIARKMRMILTVKISSREEMISKSLKRKMRTELRIVTSKTSCKPTLESSKKIEPPALTRSISILRTRLWSIAVRKIRLQIHTKSTHQTIWTSHSIKWKAGIDSWATIKPILLKNPRFLAKDLRRRIGKLLKLWRKVQRLKEACPNWA